MEIAACVPGYPSLVAMVAMFGWSSWRQRRGGRREHIGEYNALKIAEDLQASADDRPAGRMIGTHSPTPGTVHDHRP